MSFGEDGNAERALLTATIPFARPLRGRAWLWLATSVGYLVGCIVALRALHDSPWALLLVVPIAAGLIRIFVIQHDLGHHSFFGSKRNNDLLGTALSFVTGVAYEPWRTEHAWHHNHQGRLEDRGVDRTNSPPTAAEARVDPDSAKRRAKLINPVTVFVLGMVSLLFTRKRISGFFQFRPGFRWPFRNRDEVVRGFWISMSGWIAVQFAWIALLGVRSWGLVIVPAYVVGAGIGGTMFFLQHNFEHTRHASDADWRFHEIALRGSSYLRLPAVLRWFTADIGLHHVHHLNPRIPCYRLEDARREIPELAAVAPLSLADTRKCYSHVFWDEEQDRMVPYDDAWTR